MCSIYSSEEHRGESAPVITLTTSGWLAYESVRPPNSGVIYPEKEEHVVLRAYEDTGHCGDHYLTPFHLSNPEVVTYVLPSSKKWK